MRRPQGHAQVFEAGIAPSRDPGLEALSLHGECDTFTCAHCQHIVHVPPRADPASCGGLCGHCNGLICPKCVGKECRPFLQQLEEAEAREAARRSYGV